MSAPRLRSDRIARRRRRVARAGPTAIPKVKGAFAYGSDLWDERMLIGATLRSPHPFATIRAIDVVAAPSRCRACTPCS